MTAEDLKVQYGADLREGVGNLLVSIGGYWNGGIAASHTPYDGEPSYG